jgi:hypothetical protein
MAAPVKLAVVGTRELRCPGDSVNVGRRVKEAIDRLQPAVVISGGARGVDTIAEIVARTMGFSEMNGTLVIRYPKTHQFRGAGGFRERDALIARECTHLLRLACRQATTYGSGWTADEAERLSRIVVREQVCVR